MIFIIVKRSYSGCKSAALRSTCGTMRTAVALGLEWSSPQWAGYSIWAGTFHTGMRFPGVTVKVMRAAQPSTVFVSRVTISSLWVTATSSAAAGHTGAERSLRGLHPPETGWTQLTELTLIPWRTDAGPDPGGWDTIATLSWHQLHIVKVTALWKEKSRCSGKSPCDGLCINNGSCFFTRRNDGWLIWMLRIECFCWQWVE